MAGRIVILGLGNLLWADEGFGARVAERLQQEGGLPDDVEVVDGGTQGLYLLPQVQAAERLLVFDAVDFGHPPGTLVVLRDDEIPAFFGQQPLSLHQTAFTDVLAAAQLTGRMPSAVTLVGVQSQSIEDWGGGLTATVAQAMDQAIAVGLAEVTQWRAGGCQ